MGAFHYCGIEEIMTEIEVIDKLRRPVTLTLPSIRTMTCRQFKLAHFVSPLGIFRDGVDDRRVPGTTAEVAS